MRALVIVALMSGPVLAQEPQALKIDASLVDACLADTPPGDLAPACIGAAAKECRKAPEGETTLGIATCAMAEHDAWDAALNREYRELRALYADDQTVSDSLRNAQRAWIAWRDAECMFQYDRYGGGSMRTVASANCQMSMTAQRTLELKAMREW